MFSKEDPDRKKQSSGTYSRREGETPPSKYQMPNEGLGASSALSFLVDELGDLPASKKEVATFSNRFIEPEVKDFLFSLIDQNLADSFDFAQIDEVHKRCLNFLAHLFNSPQDRKVIGGAVTSGAEGVMCALIAHKRKWKEKKMGQRPNVVVSSLASAYWERFAHDLEIDIRTISLEKQVDRKALFELIDENTICFGAILGSEKGDVDPIDEVNEALIELKESKSLDIPIHVDGNLGGFILPFSQPSFEWDFRCEQVRSISVSGDQYGLSIPSIGWLLWRNEKTLPKKVLYEKEGERIRNYLQTSQSSLSILIQYYHFLSLGKEGYKKLVHRCLEVCQILSEKIESEANPFTLLSKSVKLPVVRFSLKQGEALQIIEKMRARGWILGLKGSDEIQIVVKEGLGKEEVECLWQDLRECLQSHSTDKRGNLSP